MKPAALAALRQRLNLTQAQLAATLGVHRVTVARWETGASPISTRALARLHEKGRELKMNATLERSRTLCARVRFLTGPPTSEEAKQIETALLAGFSDDDMEGYVDVWLSREPEGFRVTSAISEGSRATDWRVQVIEALRNGHVRLAH